MIKHLRAGVFVLIFNLLFGEALPAQDFGPAGVTLLRETTTNLNGAGVRVAQPEAAIDTNGIDWEVNPAYANQPVSIFTYYSNNISTNNFPNNIGGESGHADSVAWNFYAIYTGVATNIAHVDNYDAQYFAQVSEPLPGEFVASLPSGNINDPVVNQSFIFEDSGGTQAAAKEQEAIDSAYDTYAATYNTLFIGGAGNGSPTYVSPPATCYNGIGVGVYNGGSSTGPTVDNGRCKPDITAIAPGGDTSFSAPYVAGAAALLLQAGFRGDGGSDIASATNIITLKSLLLNGAVKPSDWTNIPPAPLDFRYGAGVLNVFNSYREFAGGKHNDYFSTNVPTGTPHPPITGGPAIPVMSGWDFDTNTSSASRDAINHYFFNVTNATGGTFTLTTTLVWNRHASTTAINNLALFLYNAANSNLVAASTSVVDNVQHLFVPRLAQGQYDLEVWKAGGPGTVSSAEPYALTWAIFTESLSVTRSGANVFLSWPVYPAGFTVAGAGSLTAPITWSTNNLPAPVYTNNENVVWLSSTNTDQFYRLQTPDF